MLKLIFPCGIVALVFSLWTASESEVIVQNEMHPL